MSQHKEKPFVIGAGLGRTGTKSLHEALNTLGYKTFHMFEILDARVDATPWFDWAKAMRRGDANANELTNQLLDHLISNGYNATTDYPACLLYLDLYEKFPNAKVILSIRSKGGESWRESVEETIGTLCGYGVKPPFSFIPFFRRFCNDLTPFLWERTGIVPMNTMVPGTFLKYADNMAQAYDKWVENVIKTIPAESLLVHKASDGFAPICKHIGIPETECPAKYPYVNDRAEAIRLSQFFYTVTLLFWPVVIAFLLGIGAFCFTRKRRSRDSKIKHE